ncbi:contractile injection system tape measure protein [Stigmatella sp. ncwal1]|uniref:Contractile injection system tape measure protein n=1 Tax=Stigmatella ashevillensis TaxID=2995309 RepID=A0ABT5DI17_9BACT|nr:contractile injection system tape measure protein [Stigmatella ashevillena]MDC0713302.1 contractile injection system tape measure protein [Stigmatella ashevillena]
MSPQERQTHAVQRLLVEATSASPDRAPALWERLSRLCQGPLGEALAHVLSRHASEEEVIRLDRLELDAGVIRESHLEEDLIEATCRALEAALAGLPPSLSGEGTAPTGMSSTGTVEELPALKAPERLSAKQRLREGLRFLLLHGTVPWWHTEEEAWRLEGLLERVARDSEDEARRVLRETGQQARVRRRLALQLTEPGLQGVVRVLERSHAPFVLSYLEEWERHQSAESFLPAAQQDFRVAKWEFVLAYLLVECGSRFNTRMFVRSTISAMAQRFNVDYGELLAHLRQATHEARFPRSGYSLRAVLDTLWQESLEAGTSFLPEAKAGEGDAGAGEDSRIEKSLAFVREMLVKELPALETNVWGLRFDESFPAAAQAPARLRFVLLAHWGRPRVRLQLAARPEPVLESLVRVVVPSHAEEVLDYSRQLQRSHEHRPLLRVDAQAFRRVRWRFILDVLVLQHGSAFSMRSFIRATLERMAAHDNLEYGRLLSWVWQQLAPLPRSATALHPLVLHVGSLYREWRQERTRGLARTSSGLEATLSADSTPRLARLRQSLLQITSPGADGGSIALSTLLERAMAASPSRVLAIASEHAQEASPLTESLPPELAPLRHALLLLAPPGSPSDSLALSSLLERAMRSSPAQVVALLRELPSSLLTLLLSHLPSHSPPASLTEAFPASDDPTSVLEQVRLALLQLASPGSSGGSIDLGSLLERAMTSSPSKVLALLRALPSSSLALILSPQTPAASAEPEQTPASLSLTSGSPPESDTPPPLLAHASGRDGLLSLLLPETRALALPVRAPDDSPLSESLPPELASLRHALLLLSHLPSHSPPGSSPDSSGGSVDLGSLLERAMASSPSQVMAILKGLSRSGLALLHSHLAPALPPPTGESLPSTPEASTASLSRLRQALLHITPMDPSEPHMGLGVLLERASRASPAHVASLLKELPHAEELASHLAREGSSPAPGRLLHALVPPAHRTLTLAIVAFVETLPQVSRQNPLHRMLPREFRRAVRLAALAHLLTLQGRAPAPEALLEALLRQVATLLGLPWERVLELATQRPRARAGSLRDAVRGLAAEAARRAAVPPKPPAPAEPKSAVRVVERFLLFEEGSDVGHPLQEHFPRWLDRVEREEPPAVHRRLASLLREEAVRRRALRTLKEEDMLRLFTWKHPQHRETVASALAPLQDFLSAPQLTETDRMGLRQTFWRFVWLDWTGHAKGRGHLLSLFIAHLARREPRWLSRMATLPAGARLLAPPPRESPKPSRPPAPAVPPKPPPKSSSRRPDTPEPPPVGLSFSTRTAGLVLLWPLLSRYFERLKLVENNAFRDTASQERATGLLQFLATGLVSFQETELTLGKLLCGLEADWPVPLSLEVDSETRALSEGLLSFVLQSWKALQNTSIPGLRGSFLCREGRLTSGDGKWNLEVEPKTLDILLDSWPWPLSLVKLPWMPQPLFIRWRK